MKKILMALMLCLVSIAVFTSCYTGYDSGSYDCVCKSTITTYGEYGTTEYDSFTLDKIDGVPCSDYSYSDVNEYGTVRVDCH